MVGLVWSGGSSFIFPLAVKICEGLSQPSESLWSPEEMLRQPRLPVCPPRCPCPVRGSSLVASCLWKLSNFSWPHFPCQ